MSMYLWHDPRFTHQRPTRLLNQHFGLGFNPEDPLLPRDITGHHLQCPLGYTRHWHNPAAREDGGSTVHLDKNHFTASLDVQQFTPEEITVKVTDDHVITIEGKHEEKEDEHGLISRHFVRKYVMPKGHDIGKVASKLSSDGVLTITAPRIDHENKEGRHVPVALTGEPHKAIEKKGKEE